MGFSSDWAVLVPVMAAVIIGGLGFPVLVDLRRVRGRWHELTLHSKVTLSACATLLVVGIVLLSTLEWGNPATLGPMPVTDKVLNGTFASVAPRTAGFNSIDVAGMQPQSQLATIGLMFIGAGSAGTSGGIKVSTFAILALVIWSQLRRGLQDVTGFHRRIPDSTQRRAITVALHGRPGGEHDRLPVDLGWHRAGRGLLRGRLGVRYGQDSAPASRRGCLG